MIYDFPGWEAFWYGRQTGRILLHGTKWDLMDCHRKGDAGCLELNSYLSHFEEAQTGYLIVFKPQGLLPEATCTVFFNQITYFTTCLSNGSRWIVVGPFLPSHLHMY